MKKLFILFIAVAGFGVSSYAQVAISVSATAKIITPIAMAKTGDFNFGNIAIGALGGVVTLTPAGGRSADGGLTLPTVNPGTVTTPSFKVDGEIGNHYTISILPTSILLTEPVSKNTVSAGTFTNDATGVLTLGTETFKVGAKLTVGTAAITAAGTYVNAAELKVSVNYE